MADAIGYVDGAIGKMIDALKAQNLARSTMIVVTARHGQSPTDHTKLVKNGDTLTSLLEAHNYLDSNGHLGQNSTASGNLNDRTPNRRNWVSTMASPTRPAPP